MGISNWIKRKEVDNEISKSLKDWQLKLLEGKNIRKDELLSENDISMLVNMDESTFKRRIEFYTKYSSSEQCDIWMGKVFEGVYELDISNPDYLSHFLIPYEDEFFLFINKCGRSHFTVYKLDYNTDLIEYDENSDHYKSVKSHWNREDWEKVQYVFSIRLKDIEFIKEFLENLLQRNIEFRKSYKRELKLKEILN